MKQFHVGIDILYLLNVNIFVSIIFGEESCCVFNYIAATSFTHATSKLFNVTILLYVTVKFTNFRSLLITDSMQFNVLD